MSVYEVQFTQMSDATHEEISYVFTTAQATLTKNLVDELFKMLEALKGEKFGYQVDRYEHSLQTATRALRDDARTDMVVAGLLHDIGDAIAPANHSQLAAAMPAAAGTSDGSTTDIEEHQIVAVFSPKGGAGRTTIATNLALALRKETGARVCLVDANLQFGDVGVLLNLNPKNRSIMDAVERGEPDGDVIDSVVVDHSTGIRVLLAPPSPEGADLVTPQYLRKIVDHLRGTHDYVVVDLPAALNDHSLAVMDAADMILVLSALEITTIKNVRLFLEVADQLEYDRGKIRLVINRADAAQGIRIGDVEASIRRPIDGSIVSDGRLAVLAVNRGVPFVVSHPEGALSRDIFKLARTLAGESTATTDKPSKRGLFARR